ncbi:MAG: hypothetical protein IT164_16895 [Bryobacterales bacterium]|nr:hypothetical protein [Bryobacterales bacterium]
MSWVRQYGTTRVDQGGAIAYGEFGVFSAGDTVGEFPGETRTHPNNKDAFVSLHDENGKLRWVRQFGSTNGVEDGATAVAADGSGAYVVGTTLGTLPGMSLVGGRDIFIRKYDGEGNVLWTKQSGTTAGDWALAALAHTTGLYVAGYIECCGGSVPGQPPLSGQDAFVSKFDGNGNLVWTKLISTNNSERAVSLAADITGVYVGGVTGGVLKASAGGMDAFVRKFDFDGNILWTAQFGAMTASGVGANDELYAVGVGLGGVYVSGATPMGIFPGQTFSGGLWDAYVAKLSPDGVLQWVRQFGSTGDDHAYALAVGLGHILVGGGAGGALPGQTHAGNEDAFLRLYDLDGNLLNTRQFGNGGNDSVNAIAAYRGGFLAGGVKNGTSLQLETIGDLDMFAMKLVPPPVVPEGAILNAASFATQQAPLAPGSLAVVFGAYLNDGSNASSTSIGPDGKVVTTLGGTAVTVNNVPAPLLYSLPGQLAIQIPFEVAGLSSAPVRITTGGQTSASRSINIAPAAPGLFTVNMNGSGDAIVVHSDGVTLVTIQNPAKPNEVVVMYGTGLGALNPTLETGALSGAGTAVSPTVLLFGTVPATIDYAGTTPGYLGLNQINARIPANPPFGNAVPILFSAGGRQSNVAAIAIAP